MLMSCSYDRRDHLLGYFITPICPSTYRNSAFCHFDSWIGSFGDVHRVRFGPIQSGVPTRKYRALLESYVG